MGVGVPEAIASEAVTAPQDFVGGNADFRPPPLAAGHGRSNDLHRSAKVIGGVSKRTFDIVAASIALVILAPALLGIWALVRIDSSGPGLFRQRRGGFEGRPFRILKFRTMKTQESRSIAQARDGDDRTTALGRFLRKYSVDELPQLINVLKGDMSIIGPRPHALAHDRKFGDVDRRYAYRHRARPGITGLAQVSGARGLTDTDAKIVERLEYDLTYVTNWSWAMDVKVLLRTVRVLLSDRSAF
jgi:putative colanic acid biosysnthesis UDP-glucose lipid carrier transferase